MVDFEEFDDNRVGRELDGANYASQESRECLLAIPKTLAVKIGLFLSRYERRNEALAESEGEDISENIKIVFVSARVPVDGAGIGAASVDAENEHLGLEDEEIRLLKDFVGENGAFEVAMVPHQYGTLRLDVDLHVLVLVYGELALAHPVGLHQHLLLVLVLVNGFLSAFILLC